MVSQSVVIHMEIMDKGKSLFIIDLCGFRYYFLHAPLNETACFGLDAPCGHKTTLLEP